MEKIFVKEHLKGFSIYSNVKNRWNARQKDAEKHLHLSKKIKFVGLVKKVLLNCLSEVIKMICYMLLISLTIFYESP